MKTYNIGDIVEIHYIDEDSDLIHLKGKIMKKFDGNQYGIKKLDDYDDATASNNNFIIDSSSIINIIKNI